MGTFSRDRDGLVPDFASLILWNRPLRLLPVVAGAVT